MRGHAEVRRPLEDVQVLRLLGDLRDQLDAGRARADDAHAPAGELDALLRPARAVVPLALEVVEALERRPVHRRQAPGCHDAVGRRVPRAVLGGDLPAPVDVARGCDARAQLDVAAQVEAVRDVIEVAQDLRLGRIALAPLPLLLELLRERVRVVHRLDVAAGAGVAVPVPRAADRVALLEDAHAEAEAAQTVQRVQAGEAGADDDRVDPCRRQLAVDRSCDEVESGGAGRQEVAQHQEAVHLALEALVLDAHAVLREPLRVCLALVAQRVVLGGEHHRGRQAGEAPGTQRRGVRARAHRPVGRVVVPEPLHRVAAHEQLVGGIEVGVGVEVAVGHRIHEHLQRDLRAGRPSALRHDRRQASAGAVAGDDQRHGAARDLLEVRRRPLQRRPRVLDRGREAMLGSEAVVDEHHRAAGLLGQPAPERVELVQRAEDPAPAVVVHDHAACALARDEEPQPGRAELDVLHAGHLRSAAVERDHPAARLTGLLRTQRVQWRQATRRQLGEEARARVIQHRVSPSTSLN